MTGSLDRYPHIQFRRTDVTKRIRETKAILKTLTLVAESPDSEHKLYSDPNTGELWQLARAWNWGAEPYCFLVPAIDPEDWKREQFVDPDELLIFAAVMSQFLARPSVQRMADPKGHVENLQQVSVLPRNPKGRWFGPYKKDNIIPDLEQYATQCRKVQGEK